MKGSKMFQVSTLQALALGYSRSVITVKELLENGNTGLGTFEDVNGEMILIDGRCFRAMEDGTVMEAKPDTGVPFASAEILSSERCFELENISDIASLKKELNLRIEEHFGLNSMHMVRIDGAFSRVCARSESAFRSHHVDLKSILEKTQKDFFFDDIRGSLVCVYYPDYMDGINAAGWHFHFISEDRKKGGHVFELNMLHGNVQMDKINRIEICLPKEAAFDTYSLKEASGEDIKKVEQGDNKSNA